MKRDFFFRIVKTNAQNTDEHNLENYPDINKIIIGDNLLLFFNSYKSSVFYSNFYDYRSTTGKWYFFFGTFVSRDGIVEENEIKELLEANPEDSFLKNYFVNGSYIFIVGDQNGNFTLFNDFYGLIPVYYYERDDNLIISSSLELLLKCREVSASINQEGLNEYMMYGRLPSSNTLITGVSKLIPSSEMRYSNGIQDINNYRTFPEEDNLKIRFEDYVQNTGDVVKSSIERLYDDNLKYDLSFTGGMDSRIIFGHWPDRNNLITETAGSKSSSDFIKAKQLIEQFGNKNIHYQEQKYPDKYQQGLFEYLYNVDNPLGVGERNSYHLKWKASLGADIHMSGIGAELMGGENLYQSRKPAYVIREGLIGYNYSGKQLFMELFNKVFAYSGDNYLKDAYKLTNRNIIFEQIEKDFKDYFGGTNFSETLTERIRTYLLAIKGINDMSSYLYPERVFISPYNDYEFISNVSPYHPKYRELRKLELAVLKNMNFAVDIKIDTTHLKVNNPYVVHRFFRMLRFIFNIGYAKKIPFIQEGDALKTRVPAYFLKENSELRQKINSFIRNSKLLDSEKVERLLAKYENEDISYNHYKMTHAEWPTILKLLRLAVFEDKYLKD